MAKFKLWQREDGEIGAGCSCFTIAEIGQNHQGDFGLAQEMIRIAAEQIGVDCVKFQKFDLHAKFTASALRRPYIGPNSFGSTYGEHKEALNFTDEQFNKLKDYAENFGLIFSASGMDEPSIDFLARINVPFIKIGSGDTNNYPLIKLAASKLQPLIISTGMQPQSTVDRVYDLVRKHRSDRQELGLALLHCNSSYPAPLNEIDLNVIRTFQKTFDEAVIGYSGHETGFEATLGAVALGSKVIERHLTLDKSMKGSDHKASLDPNEFKQLLSMIRRLEQCLEGDGIKRRTPSEEACYRKLGKTLVASRDLPAGYSLQEADIAVKVNEPPSMEAHCLPEIIGKRLRYELKCDDGISEVNLL